MCFFYFSNTNNQRRMRQPFFENGVLIYFKYEKFFIYSYKGWKCQRCLRFLCNHPCLPLWATNTVYTNAMRHVSCCVKDVCIYMLVCFYFTCRCVFNFTCTVCFGPCLLRLVALRSCHTNGSNSRSKHKPDALAGLLKGCSNDKGLHTQLCFWS